MGMALEPRMRSILRRVNQSQFKIPDEDLDLDNREFYDLLDNDRSRVQLIVSET